MRQIGDDDYLMVLQTLDSLERAERMRALKRSLRSLQRLPRLRLKSNSTKIRVASQADAEIPVHFGRGITTTTPLIPLPADQSRSQVKPAMAKPKSVQRKPSWFPLALVLVLTMGVTLGWVYAPAVASISLINASTPVHASVPLEMRAELQVDGSLLVTWDASKIRSAELGILQVNDGSKHRSFRLDSKEVSRGSIRYAPRSKDLTFRLQVFDSGKPPISGWLRVVNGR